MQLIENMKKKVEATTCVDITTIIESNIESLSFDEMFDNVFISSLYESDDVLNSKFNVMKLNFAYLFDVLTDSNVHYTDPYMCILDIHSIYTVPFNLGMENELCPVLGQDPKRWRPQLAGEGATLRLGHLVTSDNND